MIDWNKPIQMRNDIAARLMGRIADKNRPNVVACIDGACEYIRQYNDNGEYADTGRPHPYDIINVPPKMMRINLANPLHPASVYQRTDGSMILAITCPYDNIMCNKRIASVKLPDFIDVEVIK